MNMSMKQKFISGGIGLLVIFLTFWALHAQDATPSISTTIERSTKVAIVDVNAIFKRSEAFKEDMANLKKDAKDIEKNLKEGQTPTPLEMQNNRKELVMQEAKIYRQTYREISEEITKYAAEHQIDLVLRFTGEPADSDNPESILVDINKPVVHYDRMLDITPAILKIMAEKQK